MFLYLREASERKCVLKQNFFSSLFYKYVIFLLNANSDGGIHFCFLADLAKPEAALQTPLFIN